MLFLYIALALILLLVAYINFHPQFGAKASKEHPSRYHESDAWDGKKFVNLQHTSMNIGIGDIPGLLRKQFTAPERNPSSPLPIKPFDAAAFEANHDKPKFVWYGHSVLLLQINGLNFLIDPMLGPNAAPVAPFPVKRFSKGSLDIIDTLPPLDAILLTHDHYDHLDYASIKKLKSKTDTWLVALGVGRHLEKWGVSGAQITEFDWWDNIDFQEISLTFTPSRHFSGRGLGDRAKSLWGGWVFVTTAHKIYWSGDGGHGTHFQEIGKRFGSFDWAFLECGQYNPLWHQIHMLPDEAAQAGVDVQAAVSIPVHWGGFSLALHTWYDPVEAFVAESQKLGLSIVLPQIGEVVEMGEDYPGKAWWEEHK